MSACHSLWGLLMSILMQSGLSSTANGPATQQQITEYLSEVKNTHAIPGMAVAIIKDNQLFYQTYKGTHDLERPADSIDAQTTFRLYSLTKVMVAVGVFQLIEAGQLRLDDQLTDFINDLPPPWQNITIRHLLSHTSGLPDMHGFSVQLADDELSNQALIKLVYAQPMAFNSGTEWRYNQTNFLLLKWIIERVSKQPFEAFILSGQFPDAKPTEVYFLSDPTATTPNRAHYYSFDQSRQAFTTKSEHTGLKNHPLSGLNITLGAFINWDRQLNNDQLISAASKASMWSEVKISDSDRRFMHGWDVYEVNQQKSVGFSGGGVSGYRHFPDQKLSIMVLTTGHQFYPVQDTIIDHLAGLVDRSLKDHDRELTETIMDQYFLPEQPADVLSAVLAIQAQYPDTNLQAQYKSIGYRLFFDLNQKQRAITLNRLNVLLHPTAYDTHGTLGYLYFLNEQYALAKIHYSKARDLNPNNPYSKEKLRQIEAHLKQQSGW